MELNGLLMPRKTDLEEVRPERPVHFLPLIDASLYLTRSVFTGRVSRK